MRRAAGCVIAAIILCSTRVAAQQLTCAPIQHVPAGEPCVFERKADEERLIITVVNENGQPMARIAVRLSAMIGTVDNAATSDVNGIIVFRWTAKPGMGNATDSITATVVNDERNSQLGIKLKPAGIKNTVALTPANDFQAWYAGRVLPSPVAVTLNSPIADCRGYTVYFKATSDAQASPDSVRADVTNDKCVASTQWRLSPAGGIQKLRANVVGSSAPPIVVSAKARKEPWLAAGLALTLDDGYIGVSTNTRSIQVTTKTPTMETTTTNSESTSTPTTNHSGVGLSPIIGINTPALTRIGFVRVSAAADMKRPTTDWYLGFSIPQLYDGLYHEDMGVDLQLMGHISKRTVPKAIESCVGGVCESDTRTRFVGVALALQLSATTILAALGSLFPAK